MLRQTPVAPVIGLQACNIFLQDAAQYLQDAEILRLRAAPVPQTQGADHPALRQRKAAVRRLRRPQQFAGAIGLSGIYDLARFWGSEKDDLVLRSSPLLYLGEKGIANKLTLAKAEENSLMLCAGQGAYEDDAKADTQALADLLKAEGLPAHLELWGGDVSHEWYWWGKMLGLFVPRILEK